VAQQRIRSRSKYSRHPPSVPRDPSMADGIDACMRLVQPSLPDPPVDLFLAPALVEQLNPTNHPVLPASKLREPAIVSASTRFSLLYKVFGGLAGHTRSVSSYGARVARRSQNF